MIKRIVKIVRQGCGGFGFEPEDCLTHATWFKGESVGEFVVLLTEKEACKFFDHKEDKEFEITIKEVKNKKHSPCKYILSPSQCNKFVEMVKEKK